MASLAAISRAASNRAKTLQRGRLWLHGGTFVISVAAMFVPEPYVQIALIGAIITEGGAWLQRQRASELHILGEEARRLGIAMEGFGVAREAAQAIDLRAKISPDVLEAAEKLDDPNYYASTLPAGRRRVAELLEESSFWSKHLYRAAARESLWISGFALIGLLIAGLIAAPFAHAGTLLVISRAVVILLGLLISVDEVGAAMGWSSAADSVSRVNAQLEKIDVDHEPQLLTLFADYSVATATAAPIPQHVYDREKYRLNQLWQQRRAG